MTPPPRMSWAAYESLPGIYYNTTVQLARGHSFLIRIPIDDQVGLRLDAQDLISSADFGTGKKVRNDLLLTAGLGISW